MHSHPLAQLSAVLDKLMNGNMLEAKTRRVDWSDVDEDTFVRLCEYAYLHDYTPPSPLEIPVPVGDAQNGLVEQADITDEVPEVAEPEPEPEYEPEYESEPEPEPEEPPSPADEDKLPYIEKSIWTRHLRDSFSRLALEVTNNNANQAREARFCPQSNSKHQDFTPVFLGHVRLCLLADKYMIEPLHQLALCKIAQTLKQFTLYRQSVPAVIEFVRFVYADTVHSDHAIGPLRKLATSYMVSSLGRLGDDENFQALLAEGGDFVADFWRAVWKAD